MGLDQYAYVAAEAGQMNKFWGSAEANENGDFVNPTVTRPREIMYRRKHPNLQGWMQRLWEQRGCPGAENVLDATFNGIELELTWADIDNLERDVLHGQLPATRGFFFGDSKDDHYRERDLEFCREARAALFLGERVFYNSSW